MPDTRNPPVRRHTLPLPPQADSDTPHAIHVLEIGDGDGPTLLLTGGVHGDELEGPVAIMDLGRTLLHERLRGTLILVPSVNPSAMAAARRESPIDGLDLNRCFPGDAQGSYSRAVASALMPLVERADFVFDLHAGGTRFALSPCVLIHPVSDAGLMARTLSAALAFGAPVCVLIDEGRKAGMLDTEVERRGRIFGCAELGGFGSLSPHSMDIAANGVRNLLVHFGLLDGRPGPETPTLLTSLRPDQLVEAPAAGLFEPLVELGATVAKGSPIGRIHNPAAPWADPVPVAAPCAGTVFFRHAGGMLEAGQSLFILGDRSTVPEALAQAAAFPSE